MDLFFYLTRGRWSSQVRVGSGRVGSGQVMVWWRRWGLGWVCVCGTASGYACLVLGLVLSRIVLPVIMSSVKSVNQSIGRSVRPGQSVSIMGRTLSVAWGFNDRDVSLRKWGTVCEKNWSQSRSYGRWTGQDRTGQTIKQISLADRQAWLACTHARMHA